MLLVPQVEHALLLGHVLPHGAVVGPDVELELLVVHGAGHGNGLLLEDHLNIINKVGVIVSILYTLLYGACW